MLLYRFSGHPEGPRLYAAATPIDPQGAGEVVCLSSLDPVRCSSLSTWLRQPDPSGVVREALSRGEAAPHPSPVIAPPIDSQEVWAAGVTYLRSKEARMEESEGGGSFYDRVYAAERPEIFLKATPSRVVGPSGPVRIRRDAQWNVPEPEVALVVSADLRIVGYTIGNDMSSRDIEGENPLYLPQAKVYRQSCALGPGILLEEEPRGHRNFAVALRIEREGSVVFQGETETARMKRRFDELVEYLGRDNLFPDGVFLLTGTGVVPPDDFTLEPGDVVTITVPEIGTLQNTVVRGDAS
jgi:2-dehydro-3-deoxy-D-arabinonate dehydratase